MPFQQGISGNPKGRPKGLIDQSNQFLKNSIKQFLLEKFNKIESDFEQLNPKERVKTFIDLLPYALPKIQSIEYENRFEFLPDEQLNAIIEELKITANEKEDIKKAEN